MHFTLKIQQSFVASCTRDVAGVIFISCVMLIDVDWLHDCIVRCGRIWGHAASNRAPAANHNSERIICTSKTSYLPTCPFDVCVVVCFT